MSDRAPTDRAPRVRRIQSSSSTTGFATPKTMRLPGQIASDRDIASFRLRGEIAPVAGSIAFARRLRRRRRIPGDLPFEPLQRSLQILALFGDRRGQLVEPRGD